MNPLDPEALELATRRARRALARPGARLHEEARLYAVRASPDRRRRPSCVVPPQVFAALAASGALHPLGEGVWSLARTADPLVNDEATRPRLIEGQRLIAEPDGALVSRRVNLAESPLRLLAARKNARGQPLLTDVELAAGERLRDDFVRAGLPGRVTMDWSAGPRGKAPRGPGADPHLRARAAKDRLHAALEAAGPGLRELLERVCLAEATLESAERALGHPRRSGRPLLKLALQRVATFYGIG